MLVMLIKIKLYDIIKDTFGCIAALMVMPEATDKLI